MKQFFDPVTIVVIGASTTPGKAGHSVLMNIAQAIPADSGKLWAVHLTAKEIGGVPCQTSIKLVPPPVDLAVICLPPDHVLPAIEEALAAGARGIIIESGSLATDEHQAKRNTAALKQLLSRTNGQVRVMGPNSIGIVNLRTRLNTSLIPYSSLPRADKPGVAVAGQTGLIASGYLQRICEERLFRLSKICCLGNKLDVNEQDALAYLKDDPDTRVIAIYLEDVKDGRRFFQLLKETTRVKPIVLYKGGLTPQGAKAASSHTGSIAGSGTVFAAMAQQAGAFLARNFEQLFATAEFLAKAPRPRGNRVGIISITGAGCVLSVDAAAQNRLVVPPLSPASRAIIDPIVPTWDHVDNPVDLWSTIEKAGARQAYTVATRALLAGDTDAIVIINLAMPESELDWSALSDLKRARPEVPIVLCLLGGWPEMRAKWVALALERDFPVTYSPDDALRIIGQLALQRKM